VGVLLAMVMCAGFIALMIVRRIGEYVTAGLSRLTDHSDRLNMGIVVRSEAPCRSQRKNNVQTSGQLLNKSNQAARGLAC
jgi:hypothetical protein